MDIERLKEARRLLGKMNPLDGSDWADALDIAERATDDAIARQSATSEEVAEAIEILRNQNKGTKKWAESIDDGIDWEKYIKANDLAITALQQYQPWVSVNDRLPNNMPVVIYSQFGIGIGHYNPVLKTWIYYGKSSNCTVTHWKSLPEPPKGE